MLVPIVATGAFFFGKQFNPEKRTFGVPLSAFAPVYAGEMPLGRVPLSIFSVPLPAHRVPRPFDREFSFNVSPDRVR